VRDYHKRVAPALLVALAAPLLAQVRNGTLTIGELTGRVDPRDYTLTLSTGYVRSSTLDDDSAARVLQNAQEEILLQLKGVGPKNPDRIAIRFFDSEQMLQAALITGEADFAMLGAESSVREILRSSKELRVVLTPVPRNTAALIGYNLRYPLFRNANVRRALAYAIDRQAIIQGALDGKAEAASGPFSARSWAYAPGLEDYDYDPRRAVQMLAEEGWRDSDGDGVLNQGLLAFQFSLLYEKGMVLEEKVIRSIKINLNEIGVDVIPRPLSKAEIKQRLRDRNFDAVFVEQQFLEVPESLEQFFSARSESNFLSYSNPTAETYFRVLKRIGGRDRQKSLFQAIQKVISREQPVTFLYFRHWNYYLINRHRFVNFLDSQGRLKPFDLWELSLRP